MVSSESTLEKKLRSSYLLRITNPYALISTYKSIKGVSFICRYIFHATVASALSRTLASKRTKRKENIHREKNIKEITNIYSVDTDDIFT